MPPVNPFHVLRSKPENVGNHPHERFSHAKPLEVRLRNTVKGEVRGDAGSRARYAMDASNYRRVPSGLVIPRGVEMLSPPFLPAANSGLPSCLAVGARV